MPRRKDVDETIGTSGYFSRGRKPDTTEYDKYYKLKHPSRGSLVRHEQYGEGFVLSVRAGRVEVKFNGKFVTTVSPHVLEVISE